MENGDDEKQESRIDCGSVGIFASHVGTGSSFLQYWIGWGLGVNICWQRLTRLTNQSENKSEIYT